MDSPTVRKYGPNGTLMEWEAKISPSINDQVIKTADFLGLNHSDWILELVPSYHSLTIYVKKGVNLDKHIDICQYLNISINEKNTTGLIYQIPVCYDSSFGYDFESITKTTGLSMEEIINLHSETNYRIYGMGFLPGFLYLGGLDERIHIPRKSIVNQLVPKGSVAIGGRQTGIYPQKSPGGWNIIGRTPIELFDSELDSPTPFVVGNYIQFVSVSLTKYEEIQSEVSMGSYELKFLSDD